MQRRPQVFQFNKYTITSYRRKIRTFNLYHKSSIVSSPDLWGSAHSHEGRELRIWGEISYVRFQNPSSLSMTYWERAMPSWSLREPQCKLLCSLHVAALPRKRVGGEGAVTLRLTSLQGEVRNFTPWLRIFVARWEFCHYLWTTDWLMLAIGLKRLD